MNRGKILISPELLMEVLLLNNLYDLENIEMSHSDIVLYVKGVTIPEVNAGDDLPILIPVYQRQAPLIIKDVNIINK